MTKISVTDFTCLTPAALRLAEARFLFERLKDSGRADHDSTLFLMTTYFDSFLFCLVSIEEMITDTQRDSIRSIPVFRFFKALRNITTHHSVLTGIKDSKFPRPITRIVSIGVGCQVDDAAKFCVIPEKLHFIFDEIVKERPGERKTIEFARAFLNDLSDSGRDILVADLMQLAITEIEPHVS